MSMEYRAVYSDSLSHHGILGQKWGVRRFQNADRTWTDEGKKRYGRNSKSAELKEGASKSAKNDHQTAGSTKEEKAKLAVSAAINVLSLNPIGAAQDIHRLVRVGQAYAKERAAEKRLSLAETDKKTGLKKKAKEMSAEEDMKLTNPGYGNFNTNTKNNCVLCSTAFELRRRGYDVIASKAAIGYSAEEYTKWFKGAKTTYNSDATGAKRGALPTPKRSKELKDWAESSILSQGEGARGYLSAAWSPYAGHSMAYEVRNNKVNVYDAQCGKKYSLGKVARMSVDIGYTRLDDKEPNFAAMRKAGVI